MWKRIAALSLALWLAACGHPVDDGLVNRLEAGMRELAAAAG